VLDISTPSSAVVNRPDQLFTLGDLGEVSFQESISKLGFRDCPSAEAVTCVLCPSSVAQREISFENLKNYSVNFELKLHYRVCKHDSFDCRLRCHDSWGHSQESICYCRYCVGEDLIVS